jgi:hypothetical protein
LKNVEPNSLVKVNLTQTRKNDVFLISYVFSSTKSEKRAEHVLPGSWRVVYRGGTNNVYICK